MGCFEVYQCPCWVSSQNMNVGVNDLFKHAFISFDFFGLSLAFLYHYEM